MHPAQRLDHALDNALASADGDQMDDHLGVGSGLEDAAARDEIGAERERISEVAVVRDAEPAEGKVREKRLDIAHLGRALGGVAVVADRGVAFQRVDYLTRGEDIADPPERPVRVEERAVSADDAGRFLPPMLQSVQAERGMGRSVGVAEDAEDPAFFAQLVVVSRAACPGWAHHSTLSLKPSSWFRSRSL